MKICIDLGHCDTTGAVPVMPIGNSHGEVRRLSMTNRNQVICTQLLLTYQQMQRLAALLKEKETLLPDHEMLKELGEIRIGNDLPHTDLSESFRYFKVPPKDFHKPCGNSECAKEAGLTHGQIMACYVYSLLEALFKNNPEELKDASRDQTTLYIGCPSTEDWTSQQARNEYALLVKLATNVQQVFIVPESRAAMFSSIDNKRHSISASGGAAVFDFGSSTADFTYMLTGRKLLEFSWSLGAYEIEHQMALWAYRQMLSDRGRFNVQTESFSRAENELRTIKEQYFAGSFGPDGHPWAASFVNAETGKRVTQLMIVDDDFMQQVLSTPIQIRCDSATVERGGWLELCRRFFAEAKAKIEEATYEFIDEDGNAATHRCTVENIVLTGGASKMGFICEVCKEVFPGMNIILEENPSHTVSNGLGWVSLSDSQLENCIQRAKNKLVEIPAFRQEALKTKITDALYPEMMQVVQETLTKWAQDPSDKLTLNDLKEMFDKYQKEPETAARLHAAGEAAIREWKNSTSDEVMEAVNGELAALYAESVAKTLLLPKNLWSELKGSMLCLDALKLNSLIDNINFAGFMTRVCETVCNVLLTCIAWYFAPETYGLSVAAAFIGQILFGKWINEREMKKERTQEQRKTAKEKITNASAKEKEKIAEMVGKSLEAQSLDLKASIETMLRNAFEVATLKRFSS